MRFFEKTKNNENGRVGNVSGEVESIKNPVNMILKLIDNHLDFAIIVSQITNLLILGIVELGELIWQKQRVKQNWSKE